MKQYINLKNSWEVKQIESTGFPNGAQLHEICFINKNSEKDWLNAEMPAQVHEILLRHKLIPDEIVIGLADKCMWVAESDWIYKCVFEIKDVNRNNKYYLNFKGIDTVADIYLNGEHIAYHNDMFLPLRLDVTKHIRKENILILHFHSPFEYIKEKEKGIPEEWIEKISRYKLIRKPHVDFTDYLGAKPYLTPIGIYDDVVLEIADGIEIEEFDVITSLNDDYSAGKINVAVKGTGLQDDSSVIVTVNGPEGEAIVSQIVPVINSDDTLNWCEICEFEIENPRLWWPRGYGEQPLYEVIAEVYTDGACKDRCVKKVGFRDAKMPALFDLYINGKPIKLWGANFAPVKGISHCWDKDRASVILDMIENANMNVIRIWGEGHPYPDQFYDELDKRGILVWQDFFHGYGMQPDDDEFVELCRKEVEYLVKRLKHRPSIFMWCGGNEGFMGGEYDFPGEKQIGTDIYLKDYKEICDKLDPYRFYLINSPWGGAFANDPSEGDCHGYDTWWYVPGQDYPVMYSEHMRTSPPGIKSLKRFISEKDLWPEGYVDKLKYGDRFPLPETWMARTSAMMEKKTGPIEFFYDADTPEELVYKFGAAHALELRKGIERCRRGRPSYSGNKERKSKGHLVWKLNDTWPMIYCAIIDYYLEPYIPYYAVKRSYEPILVSFEITDHIYLWIVNDSTEPVEGSLVFKLFNPAKNKAIKEMKKDVFVNPGESECVANLDFLGQFKRENILYAYLVNNKGEIITSAVDFVDMERHMTFPNAKLNVNVKNGELEITTDLYAHCVELSGNNDGEEFGWMFEDNYFNLVPGEVKRVKILGRHKKGIITAKAHYSCYVTSVNYPE